MINVDWVDWGDAPTWVGAFFAAAAAAAAFATLRSQRKQIREQQAFIREQERNLGLEREELLAAARDRRLAQARRIQLSPSEPAFVRVTNASEDPIRDVDCESAGAPASLAVDVEPGEGASAELLASVILRSAEQHVARLGVGREAVFQVSALRRGTVKVRFTDSAGLRWELDDAGGLSPVAP
ncbi:hypothetical protein [Streptomyces pseudovenezuelae]|uniref:hypothetical protein n=1 Tax=Streptomyces pseudovenezuelae TaxID=67350 RepID=UPI0036E8A5D0